MVSAELTLKDIKARRCGFLFPWHR